MQKIPDLPLRATSGTITLIDFAAADAEELRRRIANIIAQKELPYSLPHPKELRTQIAVAKVLPNMP